MSPPQASQSDAAHELGAMLRARREALQPADVGLIAGPRRRTRGLRREEVAMLASISPTYYAFLEQGRGVKPSRAVLDALSGALGLEPAQRDYLHSLVHGGPPPGDGQGSIEILAPGIAEFVDRLDPHPTYVTGRCWDVLAANRGARVLWTDWPALPPAERNLLAWMFTAPAREVFVDWEREASAQLARFRGAAARHPGDPAFADLIERLHASSPEVRAWWPRQDVAPLGSGRKRLRHPELGEIELRHVVLQVADEPEHKVVTFAPTPRDEVRIAELAATLD
jgi:transcriptional regulator with XRE-family HTH domain